MGMVQIYTGDGKGKTTASLGLTFRALGQGFRVSFVQFLKGRQDTGEAMMAAKTEGLDLFQCGSTAFVGGSGPSEMDRAEARRGFDHALEVIRKGTHDLLVLDEINVAVDLGLIDLKEVAGLLDERPAHMEIVLTGRNAHPDLVARADLVTEMKEIKHPFHQGHGARKGIEY